MPTSNPQQDIHANEAHEANVRPSEDSTDTPQTRKAGIKPEESLEESIAAKPKFDKNWAVVIGVDAYTNKIPALTTAVNDATALKAALETHHQYDVKLLTDQAATREGILDLFDPEAEGCWAKQVGPNDRVLFYFAGHGIAEQGDEGPAGYLLPQNADPKNSADTFLEMTTLHDLLIDLKCRHMLVILDCCFAGAMRWSTTRAVHVPPQEIHQQRYEHFIKSPAWQLLTSAAYNQKALDIINGKVYSKERVIDTHQKHSPFAQALIEALSKDVADVFPPGQNGQEAGDGLLTAYELYQYLEETVWFGASGINHDQTPELWPLKKHRNGQFVFLVPGRELNLPEAKTLTLDLNPYRGLQSFEPSNHDIFFGRQRVMKALVQEITDNRLTIVLGASGTGKSSVVKAGVLPVLKGDASLEAPQRDDQATQTTESVTVDPTEWRVLPPIVPTKSPLTQLAHLLQDELDVDPAQLQADHPRGLAQIVTAWAHQNPQQKLLLTIDQFEEMITACRSETERKQFMELLADALRTQPDRFRLVLTLRTDFEPQLADLALKPYWERARFIVPPMSQAELREAIEGPASLRVLYFEPPALVERLVEEVNQTPGALPLLSFALSEMYINYVERNSDNRAITLADYKALGGDKALGGGVIGALRNRANQEYERLAKDFPGEGEAYQATMRRIMLRMVAVEGGEVTRRRVPRDELIYKGEAENERVGTVLKNLLKARLIVSGESEGEAYVEPAHDALVRAWDKLTTWTQESAEDLPLQRRLNQNAVDWANEPDKDKKRNRLWHNNPNLPRLEEIVTGEAPPQDPNLLTRLWQRVAALWRDARLIATADHWLNKQELDFVQESVLRRQRDARQTVGITLGVIVALAAFGIFALAQQQIAVSEGNARATADAETIAEANARGTAEALQAEAAVGEAQALAGEATAAAQALVEANTAATAQAGQATATAIAGAAAVAQSTAEAAELEAREAEVREREEKLFNIQIKLAQSLAEAAEESLGLGDDELTTLLAIQAFRENPQASEEAIAQIDQVLRDVLTKSDFSALLKGHSSTIKSLAFSPDGKWLASASDDRTIRLWPWDETETEVIVLGEDIRITNRETAPADNRPAAIAFSPDGRTLVSGHTDCRVRVWDLTAPDSPPRELNGKHSAWVSAIAFDPTDSDVVASAGLDGTIQLWNIISGEPIDQFGGSDGFSGPDPFADLPQGGIFGGQPIIITTAPLEADCSPIAPYVDGITSLAFHPDGNLIAGGYEIWGGESAGYLQVWDLQTGSAEQAGTGGGVVRDIAFSPDGNTLVSVDDGGNMTLWSPYDLATSYTSVPLGDDETKTLSLAFTEDGQQIAVGGSGGAVFLWDIEAQQLTRSLKSSDGDVFAVAFDSDSTVLASGGLGTIRLWGLTSPPATSEIIAEHYSGVTSLIVSPNGQMLAAAVESGDIFLWLDTTDLAADPIRWEGDLNLYALAFSPNNDLLASAGNRSVKIWDIDNPAEVAYSHNQHQSFVVSSVAFNPSGTVVGSTGNGSEEIVLWNFQTDEIETIPGYAEPEGPIGLQKSIVFSPDDTQLIASSYDLSLGLWDINSSPASLNQKINTTLYNYVRNLIFSPDKTKLAAAGYGYVVVWDWENINEPPQALQGHEKWVYDVAFSQDGQLLASAGHNDKTIRIWNAQDGTPLRVLTGHEGGVEAVAFLSDGTLVSGGGYGDGTIRIWGTLSTQELVELGCKKVRRNLTQEEWDRYLFTEEYEETCAELPSAQP